MEIGWSLGAVTVHVAGVGLSFALVPEGLT